VLQGPELRTIFLGFDQYRDELKYSNVKGKNPFKDVRVRKAFYLAIDENAIADKVMRKAATPSALMISPLLFPLSKDFPRPKADPAEAKKLLTEAGYPNGFEVTMDCPNDRYVNDEAICQAVTAMLARVGIKINLLAQAEGEVLRQDPGVGRLRHLVLPAGLDARLVRLMEHPRPTCTAAATKKASAATTMSATTASRRSRR
jgi:peptide/nickel transport system substrate-binding protein